ncbi:uncharacterized protein LOC129576435 isoform X2 [Sitodiplosis mosellana]|uniref:uncharacterized protein LOC129576435 isoform X2 n=1 Tax=Sitodiplosis mosellana TaxID=263140 RepID=UPI0024437FF1|nr:uncharacterized protein LOC129576435 isoform X2 [Sitodiplosis mosellana]XP_055317530.1 uncharacterized protein LOC129576435 isoform X2 [Sitodiplosis mosellana]
MWIKIQRNISYFHTTYGMLNSEWAKYKSDPVTNKMPLVPRPPKVKNFIAIPVHDFDLKHIRIDVTLFYEIACGLGALKHAIGKRGGKVSISREVYNKNTAQWWKHVFNMKKINKIGGRKIKFDCSIMTDSVSVSLMYIKSNRTLDAKDLKTIEDMYRGERFVYELGIDPGVRTWNATVRRTVATGDEENITIAGPTYHWRAKRSKRRQKEERWQRTFKEQLQREIRSYPVDPSPKSKDAWKSYICHRLTMMALGIAVFGTRKYARLSFDKYVGSTRASGKIAASLTNKKPSMIYLGAAQMAKNSPIGIKRRLRCPGTRKLLASFKKLNNCTVRRHAQKCLGRFDPRTKRNRFKVCRQCWLNGYDGQILPNKIVTTLSSRKLKKARKEEKDERMQQNVNNNQPRNAANPTRPAKIRLVSKLCKYYKCHSNEAGDLEWYASHINQNVTN